MRKRKQIEEWINGGLTGGQVHLSNTTKYESVLLEILLDIRDLLENHPVEITGTNISEKNEK